MSKPLDELYLTWLYSQAGSIRQRNSSRTYWSLFKQLYSTMFVHLIPNDDNRALDGMELRNQFVNDRRLNNVDEDWMKLPCSFLEMLIALSRRLSFESGDNPSYWFWELIKNLQLDVYNDSMGVPSRRVNSILEKVIWRTYQRNGRGGLFPLRHAARDQRDIEIWYQASSYLLENTDIVSTGRR